MEIQALVDQQHAAIERFLSEHGEALARQGAVVATYRQRGGRRYGPYYRLTYRIDGRQRAVYLGTDADLVRHVRERLTQLHHVRREQVQIAPLRRALRQQAKVARQQLDRELQVIGLFRKGHDIRGWRTAALRWSADPSPFFSRAGSGTKDCSHNP